MRNMTPGKLIKSEKLRGFSNDVENEMRRGNQESNSSRNQVEKFERSLNERVGESTERSSTSRKQIGLMRSEIIPFDDGESFDSGDNVTYPSGASAARRSIDVVVVDVHNENKGSEPNSETRKLLKPRNEAEDTNWSAERKKQSQAFAGSKKKRDFDQGNAWEMEESIHTIKQFEETTKVFRFSAVEPEAMIKRIENSPRPLETRSLRNHFENYNSGESFAKSFESGEKFIATSRENSGGEGEISRISNSRFIEEPKRRRKRWSKDEKNLHLTQELIADSSDTNRSLDNDPGLSSSCSARPVPVPRKKGVSKPLAPQSSLAFDNQVSRSDNEEILCIETEVYELQGTSDGSQNYRQSTKIEMTSLYNSYENVLDKETVVFDSENELIGSLNVRENRRMNKIQTFEDLESTDTSDELQSKIKKSENSQVLLMPSKNRKQSDVESTSITSEPSENDEESDIKVSRSNVSERKARKNEELKIKNRRDFKILGTSNSLTDISDLPRSKSCREHSRKLKSKKQENSENNNAVKKRKSKRDSNNDFPNNSSTRSSKDDLIEYDENRVEKFTSITIHKADILKTDFITRHPMVKVHIVEMKTGNYLKTTNSDNRTRGSYLQPMITRKFDFKENRSILPNWEEELIFEYEFDEIIQPGDKPILILFEILDLLNFAEASFNYNILGNEGCWHRIAWAFLRPVGVNGTSYINKKVRLQLYEPSKTLKKSGGIARCEVFNWWRLTGREKYPSTLYITLKSVEPSIEEPIVYERLSLNELLEIEDESRGRCTKSSDLLQLPKWTRLAAQSCKIPNNYLFQSETFENGSFYVTFSNNGKYLACIGSEESNYPICVYAIPEGNICIRFVGHKNFVYSLNWSNDDKYLLSVSSDQTARIWDMGNKIIQHIHMLPHPSYVYCGKFYPGNKNVIVTGCYDCIARVWNKSKNNKRYELTQELDEHKGYVNSLCFQKNGSLITADSIGAIILWTVLKRGNASSGREWRVSKLIKNNEIQNIVINSINLHPLGSRLLVHSRDNGLRMLDLATGVVLQRYKGLRNRRLQTTACLSPCGGLVLCGGEDSCLTVWSLENGKRFAKYSIRDSKIIACVAYHPLDHILAFSTFGTISTIHVMNFDKDFNGQNVGLSLLVDNNTVCDSDNIEITMKFDKNYPMLADRLNFNTNHSGRKTISVSKPGERLESEIERSQRINRGSSVEMNETSLSRQEYLRLKIQRINDTEENMKSRSAARLSNIIEKIDRILVNTTLKKDLDLTCSSNDMRNKNLAQDLSSSKKDTPSSKRRNKIRSKSLNSRSRDKSLTLNTDATMKLCNESTEFIVMQNISYAHNETSANEELSNSNNTFLCLKSRAVTPTNISLYSELESEEERSIYKSNSGSRRKLSCMKNKCDEGNSEVNMEFNENRKSNRRKMRAKRLSGLSDEKNLPDTETCIIVLENTKDRSQSNPSTSDSAGTYIMDKKKFSKSWADYENKSIDTSSSPKSIATFIIENETFSESKSAKNETVCVVRE